jgi:segregation and condensation protein B
MRPPPVQPPPPHRLLEAVLFLGGPPLAPERFAGQVRGLTAAHVAELVDHLNRGYREQGRPYLIQKLADGYLLALRPTFRFVVERLQGGVREARLSAAAVEVLAAIAYRQPVTRGAVDTLRGQDSAGPLRLVLRRGLVTVVGREADGGEVLYGTTPRFLEVFGLSSLDDLPRTEDLQKM